MIQLHMVNSHGSFINQRFVLIISLVARGQGQFQSLYLSDHFQMKVVTCFLIFALNIDCWYTHVLTSTNNLCFRAKITKMYTTVNPSFTI